MTNNTKENKLKKIIEYAQERDGASHLSDANLLGDWELELIVKGRGDGEHLFDILFDHDFAKAVFGEKTKVRPTTFNRRGKIYRRKGFVKTYKSSIAWKKHLQQAVLSKDPIQYYYKFITQRK